MALTSHCVTYVALLVMLIRKGQDCGVIVVVLGYKRNCEALFCGLLIS